MKAIQSILSGTLFLIGTTAAAPLRTPAWQAEFERTHDKLGILHQSAMHSDRSEKFISIPPDYPEVRDFEVAKTPPVIEFAVLQGFEPWYLPSIEYNKNGGGYGGWGAVFRGPDDCFYFSIGNHRAWGGTAYIIRYDPVKKTQKIVVDLKNITGWGPDEFADGKFHGDPEIDPDGNMWLLSFFGPFPGQEDYQRGIYSGGHLLSYNIFTEKTEHFGIPVEGSSWPYHTYDWKRGILFGVDETKGTVIAYDTKEKRLIFGGCPPDSIRWYKRCVLLDRETGKIYTTDSPVDASGRPIRESQRLVSWERRNNTFTRLNSEVPPSPVTGKRGPLRAHTGGKDAQGAFWCFDYYGEIFKFYPSEDRTEQVGINWGKSGKYTSALCFSPKKRYLYYLPGADGSGYPCGTPVVQFDIRTNKKKVLAFLRDFYHEKYGYRATLTYGLGIDRKGESLVFYISGQFNDKCLL